MSTGEILSKLRMTLARTRLFLAVVKPNKPMVPAALHLPGAKVPAGIDTTTFKAHLWGM